MGSRRGGKHSDDTKGNVAECSQDKRTSFEIEWNLTLAKRGNQSDHATVVSSPKIEERVARAKRFRDKDLATGKIRRS